MRWQEEKEETEEEGREHGDAEGTGRKREVVV